MCLQSRLLDRSGCLAMRRGLIGLLLVIGNEHQGEMNMPKGELDRV
jgi:hypothetical protein